MAKKKTKQGHFDGMEPPVIPEIDIAAEEYLETRDERMNLLKEVMEKQMRLMELMKIHSLTIYEYNGDKIVSLESATKVKVKQKKEPVDA